MAEMCMTLHQPWASLLVHGIKRIEGRSWPTQHRGRLWIHAAGKVPEASVVEAMECYYRDIYEYEGLTDIQFPEFYPTSVVLGCVDVIECLPMEKVVSWDALPASVRPRVPPLAALQPAESCPLFLHEG